MKFRTWQWMFLCLTGVLGAFIGFRLARLPNLHTYKLVNTIGLFYDLVAVFVLSEVLVSVATWKKFCVERVAPSLMWANTTIPIGASIGSGLAWLLGRGHSASLVGGFAFAAFCYGGLLGMFLEQAALPRLISRDVDFRWRYLGLILLTTGVLLQLISAILGIGE
jgi:hypothetical protein